VGKGSADHRGKRRRRNRIGALAGGKKDAGVGAAAGGVGGLIFDLMTRDKK
jgi:hypothetical protein